jgi:hypothetical protein
MSKYFLKIFWKFYENIYAKIIFKNIINFKLFF